MSETESGSSRGALAKALAQVRLAAPWYVTKGGFNAHQKYPFVGHPDVMAHPGRTLLAEHGLALMQVGLKYNSEIPGGKNTVLLWDGVYKLKHVSGEEEIIECQATTMAGDKSAFVASTALDRTVWLRVLALAGSEDEDPDYTGQAPQNGDPKAAQAQRVAEQRDAPQLSQEVLGLLALLDNAQSREEAEMQLAQARVMRPKVSPYEQSAITHHAHQCMQKHGIEPQKKNEARA